MLATLLGEVARYEGVEDLLVLRVVALGKVAVGCLLLRLLNVLGNRLLLSLTTKEATRWLLSSLLSH